MLCCAHKRCQASLWTNYCCLLQRLSPLWRLCVTFIPQRANEKSNKTSEMLRSLIKPPRRGAVPSIRTIKHFLFPTLLTCVVAGYLIPAFACAWALNPHSSECLIYRSSMACWKGKGIAPFSLELSELLFWRKDIYFFWGVNNMLPCDLLMAALLSTACHILY